MSASLDLAAMPARDSDVSRFWSKVSPPDVQGCMRWLPGEGSPGGYGRFYLRNANGRMRHTTAHRFACLLAYGPPESNDLEAAHGCRNTDCVAPEHLRWDTGAGNSADRLRDGTDHRGMNSPVRRLTDEQAREIYHGTDPQRAAAARYGISRRHVRAIRNGERWGVVTGA